MSSSSSIPQPSVPPAIVVRESLLQAIMRTTDQEHLPLVLKTSMRYGFPSRSYVPAEGVALTPTWEAIRRFLNHEAKSNHQTRSGLPDFFMTKEEKDTAIASARAQHASSQTETLLEANPTLEDLITIKIMLFEVFQHSDPEGPVREAIANGTATKGVSYFATEWEKINALIKHDLDHYGTSYAFPIFGSEARNPREWIATRPIIREDNSFPALPPGVPKDEITIGPPYVPPPVQFANVPPPAPPAPRGPLISKVIPHPAFEPPK